tara:strand:+ start:782 stop:1144 length:363 start_codon:yes stop_codon:yes gene_type:complete
MTNSHNFKYTDLDYNFSLGYYWKDENGKTWVKDIIIRDLLRKTGHLDQDQSVSKFQIIFTGGGDEDLNIVMVSDAETGEVFFDDHPDDPREGEDWTEGDEELVDSILMWADLENSNWGWM